MKPKDERQVFREEIETLNRKLGELSEEELIRTNGGGPLSEGLAEERYFCPDCGSQFAGIPNMVEYCHRCGKHVRPIRKNALDLLLGDDVR